MYPNVHYVSGRQAVIPSGSDNSNKRASAGYAADASNGVTVWMRRQVR